MKCPAYYNENDLKTAAWLRELIKSKLIAEGEVDERSIQDVDAQVGMLGDTGRKRDERRRGIANMGCASKGQQGEAQKRQWSRDAVADPSADNFWSRFEIVQCRDGKARRFEPESFPLADGIPGRVALLRGYGNAINPQTAAEFIQAAEEALA